MGVLLGARHARKRRALKFIGQQHTQVVIRSETLQTHVHDVHPRQRVCWVAFRLAWVSRPETGYVTCDHALSPPIVTQLRPFVAGSGMAIGFLS